MTNVTDGNTTVAVVGGGIAGLTAALRLAQRGYAVTVYEAQKMLGGNLSSTEFGGVYHDVYPHMFADWYKNFWNIVEGDLGLSRTACFQPEFSVKFLRKDSPDEILRKGSPKYIELDNTSSLRAVWKNLRSGYLPMPDMLLYGYGLIDLVAHHFDPLHHLLDRNTINGFLYAQYYASDRSAELFNLVLRDIWSIDASRTSVSAYQSFAQHMVRFTGSMPFAWLLKGSLQEKLIEPFEQALTRLHCEIRKQTTVTRVRSVVDCVRIWSRPTTTEQTTTEQRDEFDFLVLAVPPDALTALVHGLVPGEPESPSLHSVYPPRSGGEQVVPPHPAVQEVQSIVGQVPKLSEVRRLNSVPIPVADVYFNRKLPGLPPGNVALTGVGHLDFTLLDLSQLWVGDSNMDDKTALVLAASNYYALQSGVPEEAGYQMIKTLHEYLPIFTPGSEWGDSPDIDWKKTYVRMNSDRKLYIYEVGNSAWCPSATYDALPNVFFAGDYCENAVGMACVEAAVLTGLQAAKALHQRRPLGPEIEIAELDAPSQSLFLAAKLALGPTAYWAKAWSLALDAAPQVGTGDFSNVPRTVAMMLRLPSAYAGDLMNTAYNFAASLISGRKRPPGH